MVIAIWVILTLVYGLWMYFDTNKRLDFYCSLMILLLFYIAIYK